MKDVNIIIISNNFSLFQNKKLFLFIILSNTYILYFFKINKLSMKPRSQSVF
jgi:hypothetical protein